jgi:protein phosphatase
VKLVSYGYRDVGRVRDSNEDQFLVDTDTGLYAVADGMGGHAAGEIASEIAVNSLGEFARGAKALGKAPGREAARTFLEQAVIEANRRICDSIADHPDRRGMGTTMVAALVVGDTAFIGHVGDSRAYLLRDDQLRLLTEDHSWVNEQVRLGVLSKNEAHRHPMRNVVTRALGSRLEVLPEVREERLVRGDALLLCSDGLNVMLTDDEIRRTLAPHRTNPEAACRALVDAANAEGGEDNTTVVIVAVV